MRVIDACIVDVIHSPGRVWMRVLHRTLTESDCFDAMFFRIVVLAEIAGQLGVLYRESTELRWFWIKTLGQHIQKFWQISAGTKSDWFVYEAP